MERSLFRYILKHTFRAQIALLLVTVVSFPLIYINLWIPKQIINSAIGGKNLPSTFLGFDVSQVSYLMMLSFLLLALITINGGIKYWLNVFRGVVGERTMRRLRHDLYMQVLRFPLPQFKTMSAGEIIPMIVSETEPIGGFIGESINLPVFQGGMLLTYLGFIFMQDPWLGLAAIALYPPQVYLIPKLQRKINQLGKERVQTARQLSDRIGDSVAGAAEIRGNDTARLESADISDRLGRIFTIRVDIYKRKFFVKFLNNFLAQVTPFFFFSVGGYFVIKGDLSLGALVAVLGAYKDILDPWKELLAWYSTKEDVRIKYEQIVSQFEPPGLLEPGLLEEPPEVPPLAGAVVAAALTYSEEGAANRLDRVSFRIEAGEHVALLGGGHSGKDDLTHVLARLVLPGGGRVTIADANLAEVAAGGARAARRLRHAERAHLRRGRSRTTSTTASSTSRCGLPSTTTPRPRWSMSGYATRSRRATARTTSARTGSTAKPPGWPTRDSSSHATLAALRLVEMDQEVIVFGMASTLDAKANPAFAARVLDARARIRDRVHSEGLEPYIELFDREAYHSNISVGENLLFGMPRHPDFQLANLAGNVEVIGLLRDVGLLDELYAAGAKVAELMVELFADVAARESHVRAVQLHQRRRPAGIPDAALEDRRRGHECRHRRGKGEPARPDPEDHRGAASPRRHRCRAPAQDRRSAGRIPPPVYGPRRHRRVLRARPPELRTLDPGQHPLRAGGIRAGQRRRARHDAVPRSRGRGRHGAGAPATRSRLRGWQCRVAAVVFAAAAAGDRPRHHEESRTSSCSTSRPPGSTRRPSSACCARC